VFDDVVGQQHITETLKRQVENNRLSHAYLFVGTRGTGKTTCAKILSRAVNCEQPVNGNPCNCCPSCLGIEDGSILDVEEIDAASNNGVDNVRTLREEAVYSPAAVSKRVYIIDEVHMLSTSAFNALLKILEEPPEHLLFILATTELNKVPATILSRCQRFSFKRITAEDITGRLNYVARQEGINLTPDGAAVLARLADGGMRDALSLLDQCSGEVIDEACVLASVGLAGSRDILNLYQQIRAGSLHEALSLVDELYRGGKDMNSLLGELQTLIRDVLLVKLSGKDSAGLLSGMFSMEELTAAGKGLAPAQAMDQLEILQKTADDKSAPKAVRMMAELAVMRLCSALLRTDGDSLAARVTALEQRLDSGDFTAPARASAAAPAQTPTEPKSAAQKTKPAAAEPVHDDGPPPWDDSDAPPEEDGYMPPPPPFDPEPVPQRTRQPEPKPEAKPAPQAKPEPDRKPSPAPRTPSAPSAGGSEWKAVTDILKDRLDGPNYMMLTGDSSCGGLVSGNRFVVYCGNPFTKMMTESDESVMGPLRKAVEEVTGRKLQVVLSEDPLPAAPPPAAASGEPVVDALDELAKFDIVEFT